MQAEMMRMHKALGKNPWYPASHRKSPLRQQDCFFMTQRTAATVAAAIEPAHQIALLRRYFVARK
jgi:hypothetical protein